MTETSVSITSRELRGATQAIAFEEASPVSPYEADRLAIVNSVTSRIVMVARDESRGAPAVADESPVIRPTPTRVVVQDEFLFSMAEWSASANGEIRKYISAALSTPIDTASDTDCGGPLLVLGGDSMVLVHGRTRSGASLVARDTDTLDVLGTIQLPADPVLMVEDGLLIYVFCRGRRDVQRVTWDATRQQFDVDQPIFVPQAARALGATFDGVRLIVQTPDVISLYNTETDTVELVHRDNNVGWSSVDTVGDPALALTDGTTDADYQLALWQARFNPGKDRQIRDYYLSAEQLAAVGVAFGTLQAPTDPVTNRTSQPLVRRVGQRWMVLDGSTGRLSMSGDLVWRFRGNNVAEQPRAVAYNEPDAVAGVKVSKETALHSRMAWENGVGWTDVDGTRYAYLDGTTAATFGSIKTIYLPREATLSFWVRLPVRDTDTEDTLLHQPFPVTEESRTFVIWGGSSLTRLYYTGSTIIIDTGLDLYDNEWHHIALVIDEGGAVFYVDGAEVGADPSALPWTPADPVSIGAPFYLGRVPGDEPDYYLGWLGDCRIYKLAASPQFIEDLYDRGPSGLGGIVSIVQSALLLEDDSFLLLEDDSFLLLE